jgi:hypothetical protein
VRLFSERATPTRHAATAALMLAGAHTSELGHITAADLDPQASTVWVHGSSKHHPRSLTLDRWSTRVLRERVERLTGPLPEGLSPVLCTGAQGSNAHTQARVCVTVREILTRAGLSDDPGVRPASLTAYAARREFDHTSRIEDAAHLIGSPSLDTTAALIGYAWQNPGGPP